MKKMYKEEVEKAEGNHEKGNIEDGNVVEARKEDNDDEWGKGKEAEEGEDDVKVEEGFKNWPWADKAAHHEKSENNDNEKKVAMGYEKEKI